MPRNRRKRIDRRSGNKATPKCIISGSGDYQEAGVPDYPRNKANGHLVFNWLTAAGIPTI
jgi:hypothetical protein